MRVGLLLRPGSHADDRSLSWEDEGEIVKLSLHSTGLLSKGAAGRAIRRCGT